MKPKSKEEKEKAQNFKIYNSIYNFKIDTDYVTYIENLDGSYHSYTFPVIYEVEKDSLDNLLISLQKDGTYSAFIVKYNTTPQEKLDIEDGKSVDLTDKISYTAIEDEDLIKSILSDEGLSTIISSKELACGWTITTSCSWGNHANGQLDDGNDCPGWQMVIENNPCESNSSGSTNTGGQNNTTNTTTTTTTNTGGGTPSGTTTNDDTIDVTTPTTTCTRDCPEEFDPIHDKNCMELHNFSTNPNSQDEFNFLEGEVSANKEKGYLLVSVPFSPGFVAQPIEASSECRKMNSPLTNSVYGIMHTHPTGCGEGTHPMFGGFDLYSLYKIADTYDATDSFDNSIFTVYMTVEDNHYAIKINDINKLNKLGSIFNNGKKRDKFMRDFERAFSKASPSTTPTQSELSKAFLRFITQTYDLGISLYKSSHDDINYDPSLPSDEQISNWTRLKLNQYGNIDDSQNCN